jgi:hypothetical protein
MRRNRLADALLLIPVLLAVLVEDVLWRAASTVLGGVRRLGPLQRLHVRVARLPPGVALPLFLVPEVASRGGWLFSAWLLLQGAVQEAMLVYIVTKLFAGLSAVWIYQACEPALLRVRWFARMHGMVWRLRGAVHAWRGAVLPRGGRFMVLRQRLRIGPGRAPWVL